MGREIFHRRTLSLPISLPTHPYSYITDIRERYNEILAIFYGNIAFLKIFIGF
jgi:hypothetical protein